MIKWSTHQEDKTCKILKYISNIGAPKYIKRILTDLKGVMNNNKIVVGNFNTPPSMMDPDRKSKRKQWT